MESNSIEVYPYQRDGTYFRFTTVQDILVKVNLSVDPRFFPDNPEITETCLFFIETDKPSMGLDIRLRNTVLDILTNFLKENEAIIIYYCDARDGRGHLRYAKFNRWFSLMKDPAIEKQDRQVIVADLNVDENDHAVSSELTVHASILLRKTHPAYDIAIQLFHSGDVDQSGKL
ncbi:MAG: hypothetical protein BGO21_06680 [Dyadobacter sp. 50-39]|uniref:DUF6169 family protein n=1 Tax=Dyadobacter sp. 50-39 TaxID=1895756 RepID=UPI00096014B5|nr:DUF6169 family protein [Dyadobacter sp. 50-39]OJV12424.1 MAG: hypothetical protein BGO21_06680 [Dyadobacter sp. 50-39]